jgi:hypothetical protein
MLPILSSRVHIPQELRGEGSGEARLSRDLYFLVLVAGLAANKHKKRKILGGLAALQTSLHG